jgi:hypothetical protein
MFSPGPIKYAHVFSVRVIQIVASVLFGIEGTYVAFVTKPRNKFKGVKSGEHGGQ